MYTCCRNGLWRERSQPGTIRHLASLGAGSTPRTQVRSPWYHESRQGGGLPPVRPKVMTSLLGISAAVALIVACHGEGAPIFAGVGAEANSLIVFGFTTSNTGRLSSPLSG